MTNTPETPNNPQVFAVEEEMVELDYAQIPKIDQTANHARDVDAAQTELTAAAERQHELTVASRSDERFGDELNAANVRLSELTARYNRLITWPSRDIQPQSDES